jgi:aspartyl-tRNA(Asn)/glutamyl-tRNA(Gln) amidotransferase subunit B
VRAGAPAKAASNWIMGELARKLNEHGADSRRRRRRRAPRRADRARREGHDQRVDGEGRVREDVRVGADGRAIVAAEGLAQIDDESQIVALIADVLARTPSRSRSTAAARPAPSAFSSAGDEGGGGQGQPERVNELLKRALEA